MEITQDLESLIAPAAAWCREYEALALQNGEVLNTAEREIAARLGVRDIERVRLWPVDEMPQPSHPILRAAVEQSGFFGPRVQGLTLRYGIFIRRDAWRDFDLVAHELVHVAQYERFGGIEEFLREYLRQCLTVGYFEAPLEIEARSLWREKN